MMAGNVKIWYMVDDCVIWWPYPPPMAPTRRRDSGITTVLL